MIKNNSVVQIFLFALFLGAFLLLGSFLLPWQSVKWGNISVSPGNNVTVYGEAQGQQKSQVAVFSAGVSAVNDNKESAISEVNLQVQKLIDAAKTFGIPPEDTKTQNLSVYQSEETYYEEGRQKSRLGQWRVNNTVEIRLKEVERSSDLADLLTNSGANNVYGPSFSVEDSTEAENALLDTAIKNAQAKAELIAKATNRKLGKVLSVSEGGVQSPIYSLKADGLGGGGGTPISPGSQTVSKTVTVTFELR